MRASELQRKRVRTGDGRVIGRVDEIHLRDGEVVALVCGRGGRLQRFVASRRGRRVAWDRVRQVTADEIVVD
jgi:sporulation protein YlmC with PRC-barrel domain